MVVSSLTDRGGRGLLQALCPPLFFAVKKFFLLFFEKSWEKLLFLKKKAYFSRAIAMQGRKHLSAFCCLSVFKHKRNISRFLRNLFRNLYNCTCFYGAVNFFSTFFEKNFEIVCGFKNLPYLCTRFRERTHSECPIKQDDP